MTKTINDLIQKDNKIMKNKIRAFVGTIGSGKGYRCDQLMNSNPNYIKVDFADELRSMAFKLLGWKPKDVTEYEKFKAGDIYIDGFGFVYGRVFLQRLGETMRDIDKDFWIKLWTKRVDKLLSMGYDIVISDARHPNELEAISKYKSKLDAKAYFCNYISDRYDCKNAHISEKMAQDFLAQGLQDGDEIILGE